MENPLRKGGGVPDSITGNKTFTGNVQIDGTLGVTGVVTFTTTVTGSGNIMAVANSVWNSGSSETSTYFTCTAMLSAHLSRSRE